MTFIIFFKNCIYLFLTAQGPSHGTWEHRSLLWHAGYLVAACEIFLDVACKLLVSACGIQFPDQGSNPNPLHWESRFLATGPPVAFILIFTLIT